MARVLWAWELGARSGHLRRFAPLGRILAADGHIVDHAVRDLAEADAALDGACSVVQAPVMLVPAAGLAPAESHADLLSRVGFRSPAAVAGAVRGWLRLFDLLRPDLVVLDHAPTALLAARIAGVDRIAMGLGFFWPPAVTPMPSLRPWKPSSDAERLGRETPVVETINHVLRRHHAPAVGSLADLYADTEAIHCTFPELDHYGARKEVRYWGTGIDSVTLRQPPWPEGTGERIFMYYPAGHRAFRPLLDALVALDVPALVVAAGPGKAAAVEQGRGKVLVLAEPVDMAAVLADCRLIICHGGHGTVAAALLGGAVPFIVPQEVEQALLGYRVASQGLGAMMSPALEAGIYASALRRALASARLRLAARGFAERHREADPARQPAAIARHIAAHLTRA